MKKLEQISIGKLKPYEKNSRTHSDEQIEQIVASINEFGFTNPVLIDKNDTIAELVLTDLDEQWYIQDNCYDFGVLLSLGDELVLTLGD